MTSRNYWSFLVLLGVVFAALGTSYGLTVHDDAFISWRYARNLIEGHGLVFNPGERVEGYTNFSWTVLYAVVIGIGLDPVIWSPMIGAAAGILAVAAAMRLAGGWIGSGGVYGAVFAGALLATNTSYAMEAVQGLETCFFSALVGWALYLRVRELEAPAGSRTPWSGLVCGVAALTRPEGVLIFGLMEATPLLFDGRKILAAPAAWIRSRLFAWGCFLGVFLGHLTGRWFYYGELVPNTFYAKVVGTSGWERGIRYVGEFFIRHPLWGALAIFGAIRIARTELRRAAMLAVIPVVYFAYQIYVGGDYKPTMRFLAPAFVPLAALAGLGLTGLLAAAREKLPAAPATALTAVALAGAVSTDAIMMYSDHVRYAAMHTKDMEERLVAGRAVLERYGPETTMAVHAIGAIPWAARIHTIDMWGLTDKHIARVEPKDLGSRGQGHEKFDYDYVFGLRPDLYFPHHDSIVEEPVRLRVPSDFPADFEEHYAQVSYRYEGWWIQVFERVDLWESREGG